METQATILLVDDKLANLIVLKELLDRQDRLFLTAQNGEEALKIALNQDVDLVILDVQMPGMDGFEVAQILKSNKRTKEIPVIFASAEKKEHHSIMKGFEEGGVDYLFKPLNAEITRAKVAVLLKIQMQKKELLEKNASLEKADQRIRELNADLQTNLEQMEAVNRELESFSYSVSHDLRAPLRALSGYSQILEEDYNAVLDDEGKRILGNIRQSASKMGHLIDNLLEFSRLGRKEVKKTDIDMHELVESILREIHAGNDVRTNICLQQLHHVKGDYSLLTQVWINLISNAIKYSSKKEKPEVEIGCKRESDMITYYVKDNGAGFDMKYADKLFGVFQRLHSNDEFEGTGIGLAIIQRIINKQGGKVWAEAKKGEGAVFYFTLPV